MGDPRLTDPLFALGSLRPGGAATVHVAAGIDSVRPPHARRPARLAGGFTVSATSGALTRIARLVSVLQPASIDCLSRRVFVYHSEFALHLVFA